MMRRDSDPMAFISFRVAGLSLDPDHVTHLLGVQPTEAHRAGEKYSTGRSEIVSRAGIWLFRTNKIILSNNLSDHIRIILTILGFSRPLSKSRKMRFLKFGQYLKEEDATAVITMFWHGAPRATSPKIPDAVVESFKALSIKVEYDFGQDEEPLPRRTRVA
jgi:hypothetical protein